MRSEPRFGNNFPFATRHIGITQSSFVTSRSSMESRSRSGTQDKPRPGSSRSPGERRFRKVAARGAYRALVRARWDDAVAAGTPVLVTQASGLSRPILERLGFRAVGPVVELIDETMR